MYKNYTNYRQKIMNPDSLFILPLRWKTCGNISTIPAPFWGVEQIGYGIIIPFIRYFKKTFLLARYF